MNRARSAALVLYVGLVGGDRAGAGTPVGTAFTYQGQLKQGGVPVNGAFDVRFTLFDDPSPVAGPLCHDGVQVVNGLFTAELDFGPAFTGAGRELQVAVRADLTPGDCAGAGYTVLAPRQPMTPVPYALHALDSPAQSSNWLNNGENVYLPAGNVGVGTDQPTAMLHLHRPLAQTALRFQTVRYQEVPPATQEHFAGAAAATGPGQPWSAPDSARLSDDVRAAANFSAGPGTPDNDLTQPLELTNLGFTIPPQATIVGMLVNVEGLGSCSCSDCDRCDVNATVELLGGDVPSASTSLGLASSESTATAGGIFETWGVEWTPSQVNASSFGVRLTTKLALLNAFLCLPGFGCSYLPCDCTGSGQAGIDAVSITVVYFDVPVKTSPVDWSMGIPETEFGLHLSPTADLSNPAVYIDTQGHVGINTTSPGSFHLAVVGFAAKSTGTQWSSLSDRRVKRNLEPVIGALTKLLSLRGVTFEFTEEGLATGLASEGRHTGFVAQDVESVFPEWVGESSDGYKFLTEAGTTALLVEALRELRTEKDAEIEGLRKRVAALEARPDGSSACGSPITAPR